MSEHVHLLITEPERAKLSLALQMLKQNVARQLREPEGGPFWQARYYDFNVWTEAKRIEKLRYIHRNPVVRGLAASPELWAWSSFRHYASGFDGVVEIESQWTARKRELLEGDGADEGSKSKSPPCPCKRRRDKDGAPALGSTFAGRVPRPSRVLCGRAGVLTSYPAFLLPETE
jgi:putative transposase